jgi:hypothetical protein
VLYPRNQFPEEDANNRDAVGASDTDDQETGKEVDDGASNQSSQTDLSDVGLCSLNIHEFSFNTVLCLLQLKDYK